MTTSHQKLAPRRGQSTRQPTTTENRLSTRRKNPKSRGGCVTCKIRRVKCDEGKPACMRCVKTGRKCDGYTPLGVVSLVVDVSTDNEERRGFHFFRMKTIGDILGQQDAYFWKSLLLQGSHSQPAVKHALIAVASLHESLELCGYEPGLIHGSSRGDKLRLVSLHHYNKAIRLIRADYENRSTDLSPAIIMLLCLLFIVYEEFQSDYLACFVHLNAGLKLLKQWRSMASGKTQTKLFSRSTMELVDNHIAPILRRLQVQAAIFMDCRYTAFVFKPYSEVGLPIVPLVYESLASAREGLDHLMSWMFSMLEALPERRDDEIEAKVQEVLDRWLAALNAYWTSYLSDPDASSLRASGCLMLYYHVCIICLQAYNVRNETVFDSYTEQFKTIVDLARDISGIDQTLPKRSEKDDSQLEMIFSFDLGIAPPLFLVASRCRDPTIRRQALSLMMPGFRNGGAWNSEFSAICARQIMEIEEAGLGDIRSCTGVPEEKRIRKVFVHANIDEGYIMMQHVRPPYRRDTPLETTYVPLRHCVRPRSLPEHPKSIIRQSVLGEYREIDRYDASGPPSYNEIG